MRYRLLGCAPVALAVCLTAAPAASATSLFSTSVAASNAVARTCHERLLAAGSAGSAQKALTMPAAGLIGAKLTAPSGDWDVAIFDKATGRVVAASEGFGSTEVAEGFLGGARAFTVQACRRSGSASSAQLSVFTQAVPASSQKASMVEVATPTAASKDLLQTLGLDLTEHAESAHADVVAYGVGDLDKLHRAGLSYRVKVDDLVAQTRSDFAADRALRTRVTTSALPSGSTGYRHLWDYEAEMKALVAAAPDLVKPITLPHPTLEGRQVHGIEITNDVGAADGKPVFLQIGTHHAREWPSGEHAMEWAFELVRGYGRDDRVTRLVDSVRTIVVPVQNPDGFNLTREAPIDLVEDPEYQSLPPATQTGTYLVDPAFAYKRRNCRIVPGQDAPGGICALPTCERPDGVTVSRKLEIERGERREVAACSA